MPSAIDLYVTILAVLGAAGLLCIRDLRIVAVPVGVLSLLHPIFGLCALGIVLATVVLAVGSVFQTR